MKLFSRYAVRNSGEGRVEIPNSAQLQIKQGMGIFVQFKAEGSGIVMSKGDEYRLEVLNDGNLQVVLGNDVTLTSSGLNVIGNWVAVFVEMRFDIGKLRMYVEGTGMVFETNSSSLPNTTTNKLFLLSDGSTGMAGRIDRLMVYGGVLSSEEIGKLFGREFVMKNLDCFFPMQEGEGNEVNDVVTYGYKGILYGCEWVMGRDAERLINTGGKVVVVKRL